MGRELWKPIPGWPAYAVSSFGHVKRLLAAQGAVPGHILRPGTYPKSGYQYVFLQHQRKHQHFSVHRLVAFAFLGSPPSPIHQCNHKNGNKLDNRIANLEWVTHRENGIHSYQSGLTKKPPTQYGEAVYGCQITKAIAQQILDAPRGYGTGKALARRFGISEYIVSFIRTRRTWKHLTPTLQEPLDLSPR